jgi:hypothetical protein
LSLPRYENINRPEGLMFSLQTILNKIDLLVQNTTINQGDLSILLGQAVSGKDWLYDYVIGHAPEPPAPEPLVVSNYLPGNLDYTNGFVLGIYDELIGGTVYRYFYFLIFTQPIAADIKFWIKPFWGDAQNNVLTTVDDKSVSWAYYSASKSITNGLDGWYNWNLIASGTDNIDGGNKIGGTILASSFDLYSDVAGTQIFFPKDR